MKWYVVHTYSGQENSVKKHIDMMVEREGLQDQIVQVLVPSQEVVSVTKGKKVSRNKKFFPSYILIQMEINKTTMHLVTEIPGVTHFVGTGNKPQAIRKSEAERLMGQVNPLEGEEKQVVEIPYAIGESVRIKDGPFKDFDGTIEEINTEKGKLKVMVSVFGRSTPVELNFVQVESL
jgi:transcriptional antiterminator NusG